MRFEKVDRKYFDADSRKNGFTPTDEVYDAIQIPQRQTADSAGYDICTPYDLVLRPNEYIVVPTGIKAHMDDGEFLMMAIRSSVGIKDHVELSNGIGIIDKDFYGNEKNDGDMHLALHNRSNTVVAYGAGDRIAQGIFVKFQTTEDDNATGERKGGIGST